MTDPGGGIAGLYPHVPPNRGAHSTTVCKGTSSLRRPPTCQPVGGAAASVGGQRGHVPLLGQGQPRGHPVQVRGPVRRPPRHPRLSQGCDLWSRRPAWCWVHCGCPGPFPSTPVHPWPGGLRPFLMSTHSLPLRQKVSLLLFARLLYPLFLKGSRETQEKRLKQASTISQIQILVLCSPKRSPGRVGFLGPPALTFGHPDPSSPRPPAAVARRTDERLTADRASRRWELPFSHLPLSAWSSCGRHSALQNVASPTL